MKRLNPEAIKELTVKAVNISGTDIFKALAPAIVYLPKESIINIKGKQEPLVLHICKPARLLEALKANKSESRASDLTSIWKVQCGIIFPFSKELMFCSKCFSEFDGTLYCKLALIRAAETLKL